VELGHIVHLHVHGEAPEVPINGVAHAANNDGVTKAGHVEDLLSCPSHSLVYGSHHVVGVLYAGNNQAPKVLAAFHGAAQAVLAVH
jgi:hypothetical protein